MSASNIDCTIDLTFNTTYNMYELFYTTYNGKPDVTNYGIFTTTRKHNGRMDKVSYDLYNTNKYVSSLCMLNQYLDPHSVYEDDLIIYLPVTDMENLKTVKTSVLNPNILNNLSTIKSDLINMMKSQRRDGNRNKFLDNVTTPVPPTVLPNDSPQIVVKNDSILIAPNLFTNPNTSSPNAVSIDTGTPAGTPAGTTNALQTSTVEVNSIVQRVLVKQYKMKAN
jgi:hypothetical protein